MAEIIALVGGDTLLGREVREVAGETVLGEHVRLFADEEKDTGRLTAVGNEPAFVTKLDIDELQGAAVVILAGTQASSREAIAAELSGVVIDLTYVAEDHPLARIRAPLVEGADFDADHSGPQIVAHPAAVVIAATMKKLCDVAPVRSAVVHIFEPVSERGKAGIDELQQQSVNLLSFKPLPKGVFDSQVSFAMLAKLGDQAQVSLEQIEERIERHLASLLERMDGVPMPSFRVIQAPVFHGYSFSFRVEFEEMPLLSEIEDALGEEPLEFRGEDVTPPDNVGIAGFSGIATGALMQDRNCPDAIWLWAATDNLRLVAENATRIAGEVV